MLAAVVLAVLAGAVGGRSHLPVMNHVVDGGGGGDHVVHYPLLPHPQHQLMTEPSLSSFLTDSDAPVCPDDCRCEEQSSVDSATLETATRATAECWNVVSLPDLLAQFSQTKSQIAALSITYCEGRTWLDAASVDNTTVRIEQSRPLPPLRADIVDLTLSGCPLDAAAENNNWLGRLSLMPQLVGLRHLRITDSGLAMVQLDAVDRRLANLESLDLSDNRLTEVVVGGSSSFDHQQLPQLRDLNLAGNSLAAIELGALVRQFPGLQRLNLSANSLQEVSSSSSGRTAVSQLQQLDLSRNPRLELVCNAVLFMLPNLGMTAAALNFFKTPLWRRRINQSMTTRCSS